MFRSTLHKLTKQTALTETIRDFVAPAFLVKQLSKHQITQFYGVPDSLMKSLTNYLDVHTLAAKHVQTVNEGSAIAMGTGYHLSTARIPCVYMQNSGLGNAINPLLSLTTPYSIPMLILVGWRGEPGKRDEPQHIHQGQCTPNLLSAMNMNWSILPDFDQGVVDVLENANQQMTDQQKPHVLLVKRATFESYESPYNTTYEQGPSREEVVEHLLNQSLSSDVYVATTGFTSRELYDQRVRRKESTSTDFLMTGSMGHASAIAASIAMNKPTQMVYCLDGDGSLLMHLGNMASIGIRKIHNFKHIVLNNNAHESVGGQKTGCDQIGLSQVALGLGYTWVKTATSTAQLSACLKELRACKGPAFLEIQTTLGTSKNLGRPSVLEKEGFQNFLKV